MSITSRTLVAVILLAGSHGVQASEAGTADRHVAAQLQWSFGASHARAADQPHWSASLGMAGAGLPNTAFARWDQHRDGSRGVELLGMPLQSAPGALHADGNGGSSLMLPALVLAGGIAVALMVDSAGKAAKRQQR